MSPNRRELTEEIRYLVLAAQREGNRMLADALKPLGLTPSWAEALRILGEHGPMSLGAIGSLLVCEAGSPSHLLARMTDAGLVRRTTDPQDRRGVVLSLTPAGRKAELQVRKIEDELYDSMAATMHRIDSTATRELLWRFIGGRPSGDALQRRLRRKDAGLARCR